MKNIFFFSLALLNGAFIVAGGDLPTPTRSPLTIPKILVTVATQTTNALEIKTATRLAAIKDMATAPADSYSGFVDKDSSCHYRPYSPVSPDSPSSPIKDKATAPADSYSGYVDEDSVHSVLPKSLAAQIVMHKIESKNNPLQRSAATKEITTLVNSGKPVTAPADSYSGYQDNSLSNTFENLASALSDSYGAYIPDEQVTAPADSYSYYIENTSSPLSDSY